MRRSIRILQLIFVLSLLVSCRTQKSRSDQSLISRVYHNTTAHYNGYFNADELIVASTQRLDDQFQDNYNKILPIYKHVEADNPQAVAPDLDAAIEKVSLVVNLHRQSMWTDDCYLIVGKAQFLKKDYEGAEETLRYMVSEFNPADELAKKDGAKKAAKSSNTKTKKTKKEREEEKKDTIKERRKAAKERSKAREKEKKQREKERKEYNRLVKKNKKLRAQGKPTIALTRPGDDKPATTEIKDLNELKDEKKEEPIEEAPPAPATPADPPNYFLKHKPAYQEAVIWLARTLIHRDNHDSALRMLGELESKPGLFEESQREIAVVKAYMAMDLQNYEAALAPLEQAIELANKRENKARYAYILGQLHQRAGRNSAANEAFAQAEKFTQEYDMAFSAKLNQVLTANASIAQAQKELEKMLKDEKNAEYKDQIYYTLAEIAFNSGDRAQGIEYLQLSLQSGLRNPAQRTESYFRLAELYFEEEAYIRAKNYFDSTLQVMPETDERHPRVSLLANNLADIAKNLQIIERQDSLLRISELGPEERRDLAAKIQADEEEARRKEIAAQAAQASSGRSLNTSIRNNIAGANALQKETTFFAYNDRDLKRGKRDFQRKWGTRPLQDNWRRGSEIQGEDIETEEETEEVIASVLTDEDIEAILADVPDSEDEIRLAELRIQEAMFALGSLYRERLENNKKAIEILEELNLRFPGNNSELDSWYLLYLAHKDEGNNIKAQEYFDKILEKFPNSKYALVLKDPSYAEKLRNKELEVSEFYDDAYLDFTQGRYNAAFQKTVEARTRFGGGTSLTPKFALLAALCTGNLKGRGDYVRALTEVVAKYPNTDEQRRAREILRLLGEWKGTLPGEEQITDTEFKLEPNQMHYIIITFEDEVKLNDQKARLSDFNRKYFKLSNLRISNIFLGTDVNKPIIVVRRFKNQEEAMRYYNATQNNADDFIDSSIRFSIMAITQNNYREVLKAKSLGSYKNFFDANYFD